MSMEENNPSFNQGDEQPGAVAPGPFISPLHEAVMSKPMETPMLVASSSLPPPIDTTAQTHIMNQHLGFLDPFDNLDSIADRFGLASSPSLTSLLLSNEPSSRHGGQLGFGPTSGFPVTNSRPLPSFPIPSLHIESERSLYHPQRGAPPDPRLRYYPINDSFGFGNQASSYTGYTPIDPYLDPSPIRAPPMGNNLDLGWDRLVSFLTGGVQPVEDQPRVYRCNICRVEFSTPQAYGGHMSSHTKAKKAREALEATVSQAKRAKLTRHEEELATISSHMVLAKDKKMRDEVSEEEKILKGGNLVKHEGIAKGPVEEAGEEEEKKARIRDAEDAVEAPAEEIEVEILGYKSDESVNSEFHSEE